MNIAITCTDNTLTDLETQKMQSVISSLEGMTLDSVLRILKHCIDYGVREYRVTSPVDSQEPLTH